MAKRQSGMCRRASANKALMDENRELEKLALEAEASARAARQELALERGKSAVPLPQAPPADRDEVAAAIDLTDASTLLGTVQRLFPDRVVVLPEAVKSAREWGTRNIADEWEVARSAVTDLWELAFGGCGDRLESAFTARTGHELAAHENKQTRLAQGCRRLRERAYNGRTVDIGAHIKGRGKSDLRLYFYLDHEGRKVVIGHFGGHLVTQGGRRRGYR